MNRINFGRRSGVITDQCFGHGVWLDAGELKRLVEWKNSGGKIVDDQYRKEQDALDAKRRKREQEKLERWKRQADANS
jgi:Zn-finger nucleic acid-binding protein